MDFDFRRTDIFLFTLVGLILAFLFPCPVFTGPPLSDRVSTVAGCTSVGGGSSPYSLSGGMAPAIACALAFFSTKSQPLAVIVRGKHWPVFLWVKCELVASRTTLNPSFTALKPENRGMAKAFPCLTSKDISLPLEFPTKVPFLVSLTDCPSAAVDTELLKPAAPFNGTSVPLK